LRKTTKKITLWILTTFLKSSPIFQPSKFQKRQDISKPEDFFFKIHLVKNRKDQEKQYIIIFSTPVLYMYVVCKGKTLVYNRNITSFFTLKNLVILSLRRNSYLSNRNGFLWNILWEALIKIYRPQPLKSTGGILNKSNSILVSSYIPRKYIEW